MNVRSAGYWQVRVNDSPGGTKRGEGTVEILTYSAGGKKITQCLIIYTFFSRQQYVYYLQSNNPKLQQFALHTQRVSGWLGESDTKSHVCTQYSISVGLM